MLTRIRNAASRATTARRCRSQPEAARRGDPQVAKASSTTCRESEGEGQKTLTIVLKYGREQGAPSTASAASRAPAAASTSATTASRACCSGMGISILSTSRGVMSDREAREQKVGGELLCEVW